jgi:hypothetical protein
MSQRDGFSSGFFLGTIVGGLIGGAVGALLATRQLGAESETEEPNSNSSSRALEAKPVKKRLFKASGAQTVDMETARRSLEDKIAQLNDAIDDVRDQLSGVNGVVLGDAEARESRR